MLRYVAICNNCAICNTLQTALNCNAEEECTCRSVGLYVGMSVSLMIVQLITQERFAPEAFKNLVSRYSLISRLSLLIFKSVGQRLRSKVMLVSYTFV